MQVVEKAADGLSRTFDVTIPASELQTRLDKKIEEIRPQVRLKGFRPGKVPASHIRKVFGPSMIGDILQELVPETTQSALDDQSLKPAGEPEITVTSDSEGVAKRGEDFSYELKVEVMPAFEPVDPAEISLKRPVAPVEDAQVDEALNRLAENNAAYEDKPEGASAEVSDAVTVDFIGRIDGEPFEGGAGHDAQIVIGSGRFLKDFEDGLVGAQAGQTLDVAVAFPEDYGAADLQGKTADFEITVIAVKARQETPLDDAFAEKLGLEDLDALKRAVREQIEREHSSQSRARVKRRLLDDLDQRHQFDLPPRMVEMEFSAIWAQVEQERAAGNADPEDAEKSEDEIRGEYRAIAERRVRLGLVLAEIGQVNKVSLSEEEVARAVNEEARRYPGREKEVFDFYRNNPAALAQLRAPLYEDKVVDFILELADIEDENLSREDLFQDEDIPDLTTGG